MPTIMRFIGFLVVIAALVGAGMYVLGNFVSPELRPMSVRIPPDRLEPVPIREQAQPVRAPVEPEPEEPDAPDEPDEQSALQ